MHIYCIKKMYTYCIRIQCWQMAEKGVWSSPVMLNRANLIPNPFIHHNLLSHYKNSFVSVHLSYTTIQHIQLVGVLLKHYDSIF